MILAIVGSVRLHGNEKAYDVIDDYLLGKISDLPAVTKVISGGARGIDTMAAELAFDYGIPVEEFLPDEPNWPAFKKRNLLIAENCDALLRIVSHKSTTYGSGWTRDRAKDMGKPTYEVIIKD